MRNLLVFTGVAAALAWSAHAQAPGSAPARPGDPPATAAPPASATSPDPGSSSATSQPPPSSSTSPSSSPSGATGAATGSRANTATAAPDLAVGLSVRDNTGAAIGQVTDLKTDAGGRRVATIRMGSSTFAVDADKLAVENGAATINATQAQLRDMMRKPK